MHVVPTFCLPSLLVSYDEGTVQCLTLRNGTQKNEKYIITGVDREDPLTRFDESIPKY